MLTKITKWIFYLFSFLLPLSFFPERIFSAYFDKRVFLSVFVFLFFVLLAIKSFTEGRFRYPAGRTSKAMLAVMAAFFASSVFSGIFGQSVFGSGFQPDCFFALGFGFVAFFMSALIMESEKDVFRSIKFFVAGASALAFGFLILSCLKAYGIADSLAFGLGDTAQAVALVFGGALSALIALFGLGQFEGGEGSGAKSKNLNFLFLIFSTVLLTGGMAFIDLKLVWFMVALATVIVLCRILASPSSKIGRIAVCLSFVGALLFFLFGSPISQDFGSTVLPNSRLSLKIAQDTFTEGIRPALFGSGPGTFSYQFAAHNGGAFNGTDLSGFIFDQGLFGYLTLAVETGLLGASALAALLIFFFWGGLKLINSREEEDKAGLAAFVLASYFLLTFFFFWINLGLFVLSFWALGIFAAAEKQKEIVFAEDSGSKKAVAIIVLLTLLANGIFDLYVSIRQYQAGLAISRAGDEYGNGRIDEALAANENALRLWQTDDYYVSLSTLYLAKAAGILQAKTDLTTPLSEEEQSQFADWVSKAEIAAGIACQSNPKDLANWQNLGSVYERLIKSGYALEGYDTKALEAYGQAERLYPQSLIAASGEAFIYDIRGDKENAIAGYEKYLSLIIPNSQEAQAVAARIAELEQPSAAPAASGEENSSEDGNASSTLSSPSSTLPTASDSAAPTNP